MPRRTNPYQKLCTAITSVFHGPSYVIEESVVDSNPRTGAIREMDIVVTHKNDASRKLLFECRAHKRRQNVQWIDELDGKARRLGFAKAFAVSATGFTKPAIKEGLERGVYCLHIRDATRNEFTKWRWALDVLAIKIHDLPKVRTIELIVGGQCDQRLTALVNLDQVAIFSRANGVHISLRKWIDGFELHHHARRTFPIDPSPDSTCSYSFDWKPAHGIFIVFDDGKGKAPLRLARMQVTTQHLLCDVRLRHVLAGQQAFLAGDFVWRGRKCSVTFFEFDKLLKIEIQVDNRGFRDALSLSDGSFTCSTKSGRNYVLPTVLEESSEPDMTILCET